MRFDPRVRCYMRDHQRAVDLLLVLLLLPALLVARDPDRLSAVDRAPVAMAVITVLTCVCLLGRRRWPMPVLALTTVGAAAAIAIDGRTPVALATLIAVFTVAVTMDRRSTVIAWAAAATGLTAAGLLFTGTSGANFEVFGFVAWAGAAAAFGDSIRNRRAYVAAVEDRAVRAEEGREEEARRRVAEERLRIARDLHDVVAHRIAVVNVQAGVASHLLRTDPDAAEDALVHVRTAGHEVLGEVADILSVLRSPDDEASPTAPLPSMAQLDALMASFSAAGLSIDWSLHGRPVEVGSSTSLVAYRLLEEALTNAHKHGTGTAHVLVDYAPSELHLHVDNPVRRHQPDALPAPTRQHGLVGMRERAAAVGGTVRASSQSDGLFHVEASLPMQPTPAA